MNRCRCAFSLSTGCRNPCLRRGLLDQNEPGGGILESASGTVSGAFCCLRSIWILCSLNMTAAKPQRSLNTNTKEHSRNTRVIRPIVPCRTLAARRGYRYLV